MEDITEVDITIINPNRGVSIGIINPPADLEIFLDNNGGIFANSEIYADMELWSI